MERTATNFSEDALITHEVPALRGNVNFNIAAHEQRLRSATSLTFPLEETLSLLHQLTQFGLGRFLLENKGLNGYWNAYAILYGPEKEVESPLEKWILHEAPVVRATQERFKIFQEEIQKRIHPGITMASLPCGLMYDLFELDYTVAPNVRLVGIDLDQESLDLAAIAAQEKKWDVPPVFFNKDAWNLGVVEEYDLITSNGLNIYEPDDQKVTKLYQEFYKALRPGGTLIMSFLTPPPMLSPDSSWRNFNPGDLKKQKAVFSDILQVKWQTFRTEAQTLAQLQAAGFKKCTFIYDCQGMFPTAIAER